jgi:hypothetical protein
MWPDFDSGDLRQALNEFHSRQRRFGALPVPQSGAHERWLR